MSKIKTQVLEPIGPVRYFQDRFYTSRTVVMPDGQTLLVSCGRVPAVGDDQDAFLQAHPDFELIPE